MKQLSTIGLDPAKNVFQVHGVARRGRCLLLTMRDIATGGQRQGTMMSRFGRTLVKTLLPYAALEWAFHKTLELTKEGGYDLAWPRADHVSGIARRSHTPPRSRRRAVRAATTAVP